MLTCIVLAAGESRRFGSPKPLAKPSGGLKGKTVIELLVNRLLETRLGHIVVVLGAAADEIKPFVPANPRVTIVLNDSYREGQTSSFKAGLRACPHASEGVMLLPIDTPFVKKETLDGLMMTFLQEKPLILMPVWKERSGHPPVFSASLISEFKELKATDPLYTVQRRHADQILKIPVEDEGVVLSFNTPQELQNLQRR